MPGKTDEFSKIFAAIPRGWCNAVPLSHMRRAFSCLGENQYSSRVRVRTPARLIFGASVIGFVLCHVANASTQEAASPYIEAVDLYRRGEDELALKTLSRFVASELNHQRNALFAAFDSKRREESERAAAMMRAAVMLHTAKAFQALARSNGGAFRYQLLFALTYFDKLASRDRRGAFVHTWPLMVLAFLQEAGRMVLPAAEFGRRVRDPGGDSPELLLALGALEEMAWWIHHEEEADPGMKGDLKAAERHYRQALILSPTFVEARLRLGRVLTLRDEPEGLKILEQIGESAESPFRYLARLFEGDVFEKRGDMAEAERRYSAAVSLIPTAQSAYMALAHVRHARGARAEAAQDVRSMAGLRNAPDTADPWFWYSRGTAWRGRGYLDELRKIIAP
jgi:tetratricopeptide (TPR) repeat protein